MTNRDIENAIKLAAQDHGGQVDKAGRPAILHPIRVMIALEQAGASDEAVVAGVLHDLVEDTNWDVEGLEDIFGPEVAEIVDAVTRREDETYVEFIDRAASHPEGRLVKLMDVRDNLARDPEGLFPSLRDRYLRAQIILEERNQG